MGFAADHDGFPAIVRRNPFNRGKGRRINAANLSAQLFHGTIADPLPVQNPSLRYAEQNLPTPPVRENGCPLRHWS